MSYGSAAYGTAAYGGTANEVNEQIFFPLKSYAPDTLFEASALFGGAEEFYSIFTQQASEPGSGSAGITYKIYTSNGEGETPQLQATIEGDTHLSIGARPIIAVTAFVDSGTWGTGTIFQVKGRPGQ